MTSPLGNGALVGSNQLKIASHNQQIAMRRIMHEDEMDCTDFSQSPDDRNEMMPIQAKSRREVNQESLST
jgi:hypothetical protein